LASKEHPRPLTPEEIKAHPEYPHINWDLTPDKAERIDVAAGRGGPFKLSYVSGEWKHCSHSPQVRDL